MTNPARDHTAPDTGPAPHAGETTLTVEAGGLRSTISISKPASTIGRSEECDVVIADSRVSRMHATLAREDANHFIADAGSRHGVFVNGARCQRAQLKDGDTITLGVPGVRLVFHDHPEAPSFTNLLLTRLASSETEGSELEKLRLFLEAARSLSGGLVVNDVLHNMLDCALRLSKAERGFVYLKEKSGKPVMACGLDQQGNRLHEAASVAQSVVEEALSSAAEFITGDASRQSALAARQSIVLNQLRTVIAIPLRIRRVSAAPQTEGETASEVGGVLYLDSRVTSYSLSGVSHDVLRALASECAAVLESARLAEAERAARQYHQEMEIAASIQRSLTSEAEFQSDFALVRGRSVQCREVGGDFFDVHVGTEAVTAIVVDVSGKGISAALLASMIHGMFYAQITSGVSLVDAVGSVNKFLCSRVAGQKYATLMAAQLDRAGKLQVVNCGHVPLMIAAGGSAFRVEDGDLPVGLIAGASFHAIERQLEPGSRVCIITDGISESEDRSGEEFGLGGVEKLMTSGDPIEEILDAVNQFCDGAEPQDDRTVVVMERRA